jgi:MFS transporter, DHA2 family, methylenomycin A resistance protein
VSSKPRILSAALVAIALAYFMVILDSTIVNVALPDLKRDLGASVASLQWVVDGYLLTFGALLLSGGALADRLGPRRVFQAGVGMFVVASLAAGLAPTVELLVAARLVQGVGAAVAVPASLALIGVVFPEPARRARAIGVWGGVAGVAAASGPILGGVLVTAATWRLVFFVNLPVGVMAMVLIARHVPAARPQARSLDLRGQVTAIVTLACLTFGLVEAGRAGFSPLVLGSFAGSAVGAIVFVALERAAEHPMLPLRLFADGRFARGNAVGLLINLGFYGQLFVINLYLQDVLHYSALLAGLALLPEGGMASVASLLSGAVTARSGSPRPAMVAGLLVGAAGLAGLLVAGPHTSFLLLIVPLAATGFGMALTMPAVTTLVTEGAPRDRAGLAGGSINSARQIGSLIGVALFGAIVAAHADLVPGLRVSLAVASGAFVLGALVTATVRPQVRAARAPRPRARATRAAR